MSPQLDEEEVILTKTHTPTHILFLLTAMLTLGVGAHASAQEFSTPSPACEASFALPNVSAVFESQKQKVVSVRTLGSPPQLRNSAQTQHSPRPLGQGSGFIVDPAGYILTNFHVLKDAQRVEVVLQDEKRAYEADIIGVDEKTDVALIKIEAGRPLPSTKLGRSEELRIGQWLVAIGNPFGLDYSVTAGILSAKGRNLGNSPYDDFLQTDASINPGNSGGPLFDMSGNVVGMNTAIIRNGQGIGFAVPADLIKRLLPQLRDQGYVVRGYIGAGLQQLTPDLAASYDFDLDPEEGVLVGETTDSGPAQKAGLRPGDIIVSYDGKPVDSLEHLFQVVADTTPGKTVSVRYIRQGKEFQSDILIAERPDTMKIKRKVKASKEPQTPLKLGIRLSDISPSIAQKMGLPPEPVVMVDAIHADSPAQSLLQRGDIVKRLGSEPIGNVDDFAQALQNAPPSKPLRLLVMRQNKSFFVALKR